MTQIQPNNNSMYNIQQGTPLYNYSSAVPQQQTVAVSTPTQSQIYNYPQSSIYTTPNKQAGSGVNIYIYNPSAIGGPTSNSTANATYTMPDGTQSNTQNVATAPIPQQPIFNDNIKNQYNDTNEQPLAKTSIKDEETKEAKDNKPKNIVALTDDYIRTLESYLKSPDKTVRQGAIKELIKRFEEDDTRYEDPALTALLNVALLDSEPSNRLMAMSVISSGGAHGDETTVQLLQNAEKSDKLYGQEAVMANKALLKTAETRIQKE